MLTNEEGHVGSEPEDETVNETRGDRFLPVPGEIDSEDELCVLVVKQGLCLHPIYFKLTKGLGAQVDYRAPVFSLFFECNSFVADYLYLQYKVASLLVKWKVVEIELTLVVHPHSALHLQEVYFTSSWKDE